MASYFRMSQLFLLVYDVTNRTTFENIRRWIQSAKELANPTVLYVLVGAKMDLPNRMVTDQEGKSI